MRLDHLTRERRSSMSRAGQERECVFVEVTSFRIELAHRTSQSCEVKPPASRRDRGAKEPRLVEVEDDRREAFASLRDEEIMEIQVGVKKPLLMHSVDCASCLFENVGTHDRVIVGADKLP